MKPEYIALLAGLIGAIVGAASSVLTIWIQLHFQTKQENARLAVEAGIKDFTAEMDHAKYMADNGANIRAKGLFFFILAHSRLFPLIQKRRVTPEQLTAAHEYIWKLQQVTEDFDKRVSDQTKTS